jgi:rfaE bifunctional protein kinase chain/domain
VTDASRPTTRKLRVMTGPHHIVRVDYEKKRFLSAEVEARLLGQINEILPQMDAVILQDYAKGVISESLAQKVLTLAKQKQVPVLVDPHRAAPLKIYRGATVFKPNYDEAVILSGLPAESLHQAGDFVRQLGEVLQAEVQAEHLVVTRGKEGMSIFSAGRTMHVPTVAKQVYDVTGAGDTVIATLAVAYAAGLSVENACRLANFAAGVVVAKIGCVPCYLEQLEEAIRANFA